MLVGGKVDGDAALAGLLCSELKGSRSVLSAVPRRHNHTRFTLISGFLFFHLQIKFRDSYSSHIQSNVRLLLAGGPGPRRLRGTGANKKAPSICLDTATHRHKTGDADRKRPAKRTLRNELEVELAQETGPSRVRQCDLQTQSSPTSSSPCSAN